MDVKLVDRGEEGELILSGRLDAVTAPEAEKLFLQLADRFKNITLNLKDVNYVSSAGLRSFLKLYKKVHANGGMLWSKHVNPSVTQVIEMTGFSGILQTRR